MSIIETEYDPKYKCKNCGHFYSDHEIEDPEQGDRVCIIRGCKCRDFE